MLVVGVHDLTLNAAAPAEVPEIPLTKTTFHGPHSTTFGIVLKLGFFSNRANCVSELPSGNSVTSSSVGIWGCTFWCHISNLWVWRELGHVKSNNPDMPKWMWVGG